ncbi:hypothetical protein ABPG72_000461 [Tetrahymena utriculariae]
MRTKILIFAFVIVSHLIGLTNGMDFYQSQLKGQFTQISCLHIEEKLRQFKSPIYNAFNYCLDSKRFKFTMKDISGKEYYYESPCIPPGQKYRLAKYNQEDFFYGISEDC